MTITFFALTVSIFFTLFIRGPLSNAHVVGVSSNVRRRTPLLSRTRASMKSESGVILVTVIMMTLVLSVIALGVISTNISQVKSSAGIVESIQADQLARGEFFRYQQHLNEACAACPTAYDCSSCPLTDSETMGSKTFSVTLSQTGNGGAGANNADTYQVRIDF